MGITTEQRFRYFNALCNTQHKYIYIYVLSKLWIEFLHQNICGIFIFVLESIISIKYINKITIMFSVWTQFNVFRYIYQYVLNRFLWIRSVRGNKRNTSKKLNRDLFKTFIGFIYKSCIKCFAYICLLKNTYNTHKQKKKKNKIKRMICTIVKRVTSTKRNQILINYARIWTDYW